MLSAELLRGELIHRLLKLVRWRSLGHREYEVMNKLRWPPTRRDAALCMTAELVDLQVPVLQQFPRKPLLHQHRAFIRLQVRPPLEILQMRGDAPDGPRTARHLDHHLRNTASRAARVRN